MKDSLKEFLLYGFGLKVRTSYVHLLKNYQHINACEGKMTLSRLVLKNIIVYLFTAALLIGGIIALIINPDDPVLAPILFGAAVGFFVRDMLMLAYLQRVMPVIAKVTDIDAVNEELKFYKKQEHRKYNIKQFVASILVIGLMIFMFYFYRFNR